MLTIRRPQYVHITNDNIQHLLNSTSSTHCCVASFSYSDFFKRELTSYSLFWKQVQIEGSNLTERKKHVYTIVNIDRPFGIYVDVHDNRTKKKKKKNTNIIDSLFLSLSFVCLFSIICNTFFKNLPVLIYVSLFISIISF